MKMNRLLVLLILVVITCVFVVCCGNDDDDDDNNDGDPPYDDDSDDDDSTDDDNTADDDNDTVGDDDTINDDDTVDDDTVDDDDNDTAYLPYCEGDFDAVPPTGSLEAVPGTVIYWRVSPFSRLWPAPNRIYTASPTIVVTPAGDYLVAFNLFGDSLIPPADETGTTFIYRSSDQGETWENLTPSPMMDMKRGSLFVWNDELYLWGYAAAPGEVIIRKSTDNGETWTEPYDELHGLLNTHPYGGTPYNPVFYDGRIWGPVSGRRIMSVPDDVDLLVADNWAGPSNLADISGSPLGPDLNVGESQVVAAPHTGVVLLPKVKNFAYTALIRALDEDTVADPVDEDWVALPGAEKKFGAGYDEVSGRFYVLSNPVLHAHAHHIGLDAALVRNTAAIISSRDLLHWDVEQLFLYGPNVRWEAFQYLNFHIEGDDMLVASRTAFDIGCLFKPPRGHDSNLITFHRITDFRDVEPCHFLRIENNNIVQRYELSQHGSAPLGSFILGNSFDGAPLGTVTGLARGTFGDVLVLEQSGRILRFDALGNFIETLSSAAEEFQSPTLGISQPYYGQRAWIMPGDGNWDELGNWLYWGRPDTDYEVANLGSAIETDATITLDKTYTMQGLLFRSANAYTLAGNGQILIEAESETGIIEGLRGSHRIDVPVTLNSATEATLQTNAEVLFTNDLDLAGQTLLVAGAGRFAVDAPFIMNGGRLVVDGLSALTFLDPAGATLDGDLEFQPDDSLELVEGAVLLLMDVGDGLTGTFNDVFLPQLPNGLAWDISDLYTQGVVSIVPDN